MKVELIIYAYLFICSGMIVFNIISVFVHHLRDKKITYAGRGFEKSINDEFERLESGKNITAGHIEYMKTALQREANMIAFDMSMEIRSRQEPQLVKKYLISLENVFAAIAKKYSSKDEITAAFFPYIIGRYGSLTENPSSAVVDMIFELLDKPSIYSRENAMQALYTTGNAEYIIKALKVVDRGNHFYHDKLISDGLLRYKGDAGSLQRRLWEEFEGFSTKMKIALLNYFRFSSGNYCSRILEIMNDESRDDEIRFSCIRYFGKYFYEQARASLLFYADCQNGMREEYCIIASTAVSLYPGEQTIKILKNNLCNKNWYIRYNSSSSLEKLGLTYVDLIDVIEGKDRYASEILRYRFEIRNVITEETEELYE